MLAAWKPCILWSKMLPFVVLLLQTMFLLHITATVMCMLQFTAVEL